MSDPNYASEINWPPAVFGGDSPNCLLHGVVPTDRAARMRRAFDAAPAGKLEIFADGNGADRAEIDACVPAPLAFELFEIGCTVN